MEQDDAISRTDTALRLNNTKNYSTDKTEDVPSVSDLLKSLVPDWQSITITRPEKSVDSFVITVTVGLSDGIETLTYSDELPIILIEELVGTFLSVNAP